MIVFPNAKINVGLRIVARRPDGYHDIDTVMVPVPWCDILEMVPSVSGAETFTLTGSKLGGCPPERNLVIKALRDLEAYTGKALPPFDIYLHKNIPDGAGLGGGSADASFALKCANELASLGLTEKELAEVAAGVGADCPFFIYNRPMRARGIGDKLTEVDASSLGGLAIAIAKPEAASVSTREAYAAITPRELAASEDLGKAFEEAVPQWHRRGVLVNDFQAPICAMRPRIGEALARLGGTALYSAMSGSGSAVFGIFPNVKMAEGALSDLSDCRCFASEIAV